MIVIGRQKQSVRAAILLGLFCLMLPVRWAAAAEPAPAPGGNASAPAVREGAAHGESSPPAVQAPPPPAAPPPAAPQIVVDPWRLEGPSFYEALGRPDLANRYRNRRAAKSVSRVVGGLTLGVGLLGLMAAAAYEVSLSRLVCNSQPNCHDDDHTTGPVLLMGAGAMLLIAPSFVSTDPLSITERDALVKEATRPNQARGSQVSLNVAAAPTPTGGGMLVLSGRY